MEVMGVMGVMEVMEVIEDLVRYPYCSPSSLYNSIIHSPSLTLPTYSSRLNKPNNGPKMMPNTKPPICAQ
jgi:hypothetical protein